MIIDIEKRCYEHITMGDGEYREYRRHGKNVWECLMGDSWESIYDDYELEQQYQGKLWLQGREDERK